ncbi:hypothetical protein [uncultured Sphaerochaeta sp.]|uniref:hypothetical protein n=1 Tax=uncultured Sphaerochaeta sp. TaxID=886478 RepID=UPI002A0A39F2|nr:hypothetical protein [uncultured Sphaerochaeta sp.]
MQEPTEPTIEEIVFQQSFDNTLNFLEQRMETEKLTLIDLEGELHHLTIYEGQDWGGRGEIKNSEIQGQVYAYLDFIQRVKKNSQA